MAVEAAARRVMTSGTAFDAKRLHADCRSIRTDAQWQSDVAWIVSHAPTLNDKIQAALVEVDTVETLIAVAPFSTAAAELLADALEVIRDALTASAWPLPGCAP